MKFLVLAGVSALALVAGLASAQAADMPNRTAMPAKAPAYITPVFTWTGAYVGINGGYGWGGSDYTGGLGSNSPSGGLLGATLGYNWQVGQAVFGVEGDIAWSGIEDSNALTNTENRWLGTARGRLGYAAGQFMPYVTGGLAVGGLRTTAVGLGTTSDTKAGWTVGAGVEAALWGPVSAKVEYLYVDLGSGSPIPGTGGARGDFTTNIVRAGLNYRF